MDDLGKMLGGLGADALGSGGGPNPAGAIGGLVQSFQEDGGLDGLLGKLRAGGLGDQVDSWVSNGENQAVDPQQLGAALGPDTVQRLSAGSGMDIAALLPMLAAFLPRIIDMLTPAGKTPDGGLPDLGGLLGGLMGGGSSGSGRASDGPDVGDLLGGLGGLLGGSDKG